jgi:predicted dithiol-disulfide oxidoreductase (DUF899 family)
MQTVDAVHHNVVSDVEWTQARKALLAKEKELTRQHDALSAERRALPWRKIETDYVFDGPGGRLTLAELFDGRSQLLVYHFMFSPDWEAGCSSCSMAADHMDSSLIHVIHRDVTLTAVSRAPLAKIEAFKKRMGWRFPWVSSFGSDFNRDYHVSFTREEIANGHAMYNFDSVSFGEVEAPGASVFYKDSHGDVFHTYSSYGRGLEWLIGAYSYLDLVPKGRDEANLAHPMSWVRHHDRYENPPKAAGTCCSA